MEGNFVELRLLLIKTKNTNYFIPCKHQSFQNSMFSYLASSQHLSSRFFLRSQKSGQGQQKPAGITCTVMNSGKKKICFCFQQKSKYTPYNGCQKMPTFLQQFNLVQVSNVSRSPQSCPSQCSQDWPEGKVAQDEPPGIESVSIL